MPNYLVMPPVAQTGLLVHGIGVTVIAPTAVQARPMVEGAFVNVAQVSNEHAAPGTGPVDEWPAGEVYQPQTRLVTIPAPPIVGGAPENGWRVNPVFLAP